MPTAIRQFVAALPERTVRAFEQDHFTITQMDGFGFSVGQCGERAAAAMERTGLVVREGFGGLRDFLLGAHHTRPGLMVDAESEQR